MEKQEIRTFGRRHGKKISVRQQWLVDNVLPLLIPFAGDIFAPHQHVDNVLTPPQGGSCKQSPVPNPQSLVLEIGFGNGEHLRELALQNPDKIIIGAEPFINGVASLLSQITQGSVECRVLSVELLDKIIKPEYKNIKIFPDDVRLLLNQTLHTQHSTLQNPYLIFNQIWILHPDPWPKARHEKRRLLNSEFLNLLEKHLTPDGKIIIGTDHWEYFDWVIEQLKTTQLKSEIKDQKSEIISTRYQQKNKAQTTNPKYLILSR